MYVPVVGTTLLWRHVIFTLVDPGELRAACEKVEPWLSGAAPEPARDDVAKAVRLTVKALSEMAPGRSVEVRVPPFAAVQCVEGPRHTRGTPPNVVETDPRTWLELALGRLKWTQAVEDARVDASGARADISRWLPIVRL
jgi:hypothetical protein